MTISRFFRFAAGVICMLALPATPAFAADACEVTVGRLATLEGQVEVQQSGMASWRPGKLNDALCQGDTVRAAERSRATVVLVNQAVLRIDQNTAMRLDNITGVAGERSALSLFKGALQSFSRKPRGFEINTPYLNGSIEGTEFVFRVEDEESTLTVFEGTVVGFQRSGQCLGVRRRVRCSRRRAGAAVTHRGAATGCRPVVTLLPAHPCHRWWR